MIAAIYARKSTEQNGVSDEEKSVTRQIEHGKAYATKKGWTVPDELIFVDDGISGAEFVKRPGLIRLTNAIKPKPSFQFLIMSEESRLGRESIETSYILKQIIDARVRVFFYLEDRERTLDSAMDKVMLSLTNFASEMERERAKQRTHDAMLRKAKAGHVVGGKVYGYDNHNVYGDDQGIDGDRKRLHVVRRINEDEARIVRRLFERYASGGYGLRRLAKELNAEQVPPPTKRRHGWAPSAIREILHRELYRGVVTWNKTQAIYRDGTQTSRKRPQEDWLRIEIPELRIIDESLWQRVVARLEQTSGYYMRTFVNGRFLGRPNGADLRSDYLLSGIAQCAVCGGSMICQKRNPKQGRNVYACAYHHDRNTCHNDLRIRQDLMDDVVLRAVSEHLDKHIIAEAIERALPELRSKHAMLPDERHALERQLTGVETRLQHLVNSIATGKATEAVYTALQKRRGHEDNPDGPAGGVGAGG